MQSVWFVLAALVKAPVGVAGELRGERKNSYGISAASGWWEPASEGER